MLFNLLSLEEIYLIDAGNILILYFLSIPIVLLKWNNIGQMKWATKHTSTPLAVTVEGWQLC